MTLLLPPFLRQFVQYLIVGGIAFIADFLTLYLLTSHAGFHYLASATAGFLLGLVINYLLCIYWIFDFRAVANSRHEFLIFTGIGIAGLIMNNGLLFVLTDWLGIHYLMSKMTAAVVILVFNFGLRRAILFTARNGNATLS